MAAIVFVQERAPPAAPQIVPIVGRQVAKGRCGLTTAETCFCVGAVIDRRASTVLTSFG